VIFARQQTPATPTAAPVKLILNANALSPAWWR